MRNETHLELHSNVSTEELGCRGVERGRSSGFNPLKLDEWRMSRLEDSWTEETSQRQERERVPSMH